MRGMRTTISTVKRGGHWFLENRVSGSGNNRRLKWSVKLTHSPATKEGKAEIAEVMARVNRPNSVG